MTITSLTPLEIGWSCPADLEPYERAYKYKARLLDQQMWQMGIYINSAVTVAVEHCLGGKKAKSKYIEKPLLESAMEYADLTQEEIEEIEIKKMIANEKAWQIHEQSKGLTTNHFGE